MHFFQDGPRTPDLFEVDGALRTELTRRLPPEMMDGARARLAAMGEAATGELLALAEQAEAEPPVHVPYGPFGRRIDEIRTSAAWDGLKRFAAEHGVVASGHEGEFGEHTRTVQTALLYLYSASSATFSCPLAMTDAAARVLADQAQESLRERLYPRLTSRDAGAFITSGQWMTERAGGSDVGNTETVATPIGTDENGERRYALRGVKWFTSATTSEMALTLARIDDGETPRVGGSRGLSLFCVEVMRGEGGGLEGIEVNRLKDKLGTKALPTAELTLTGVPATLIGEPGRGVANISTMLNITRWYNAIASASLMALGTFRAQDYAGRRKAFGRLVSEHPLHRRTLAVMEAETAAALSLCLEIGHLLGKVEHGTATESEAVRLRGLVPLAKLTLGKQAVATCSEALEAFGGAGYIEDTGLPRLLRDAQVLPIWEGTTNVLSLDLLRAEAKSGSLSTVIEDLRSRAGRLGAVDEDAAGHLQAALGRAAERARDLPQDDAREAALLCGYAAEAVCLGETALAAGDDASRYRFALFTKGRFAPPLS